MSAGVHVAVADPLVDQRDIPRGVTIVEAEPPALDAADVVLIPPDHDTFDWDAVAASLRKSRTRNRLPAPELRSSRRVNIPLEAAFVLRSNGRGEGGWHGGVRAAMPSVVPGAVVGDDAVVDLAVEEPFDAADAFRLRHPLGGAPGEVVDRRRMRTIVEP